MPRQKSERRKETVYDHFTVSPESVDLIVDGLGEEDKQLFDSVKQKYIAGEKFDKEEYDRFYQNLRLRIESISKSLESEEMKETLSNTTKDNGKKLIKNSNNN